MLAFFIGFALGAIAGLIIAVVLNRRRQRRENEPEGHDIPEFLRNPRIVSSASNTSAPSHLDWIEVHPLPKRIIGAPITSEEQGESRGQ